MTDPRRSRVRGCLLGGAVGDALGGPVEFHSTAQILAEHPDGVRTFVDGGAGWPPGTVTDDTQMTMFTAEGLISGDVHRAYDRWLDTQLLPGPPADPDGRLAALPWLYARRAPGTTCLDALTARRRDGRFGAAAVNDSKGCGGVMRVAPVGLLKDADDGWVFDTACTFAGYTHGHPTGQVASGALAVLVRHLVDGAELHTALDTVDALLAERPDSGETVAALALARRSAARDVPGPGAVETIGGGWIAEEALAIAVYAALCHPGPDAVLDALALAVTHSGDSDSTGAICGNILGAEHGEAALPPALVDGVEGRAELLRLADELA
ncbi:ADP-ribosylglycohydrolase family protein [Pseudonocardia sp. CA-107938]|uniref:ADP-ribosylglycohydrolase family protein n=1 Tax=Pseudonocardia sp. CA-107938 TaxID=3240021 RepID=UPI003D940133